MTFVVFVKCFTSNNVKSFVFFFLCENEAGVWTKPKGEKLALANGHHLV